MYLLGVDSGGSATRAVIGSGDGVLHAVGRGGPSDHLTSGDGRARLENALREAIQGALRAAGLGADSLDACYLGVTGVFDEREDADFVRSCVAGLTPCRRVSVSDDIRPALAGAGLGAPGIIVYAGTGSVAYGIGPDGAEAKVGGWGYLVDDRGGAFRIGVDALEAIFRAEDGRGRATSLTEKILAGCGAASPSRLLRMVYTSGQVDRPRVASFARYVSEAAGEGDPVAMGILRSAARHLAELAVAVARRVPSLEDGPIFWSGGVFGAGETILDPLAQALREELPGATLCPAQLPPVVGSYLLALKESAVPLDDLLVHNVTSSHARLAASADSG